MEKTIIPIAGGKGGVGKSLFVANLGMALAEAGHSTIAVDLDLGSSNLHTYLGLSGVHAGIGDFLKVRKVNLADYLLDTETDNFQFLPGDGRSPFMANIPYAQKMKLLREINKLSARYILLDLGAGSTFNTLDFFSVSNNGIIITTFEYSAIMNVLVFLRNFLLRKMRQAAKSSRQATEVIDEVCRQSSTTEQLSAGSVIEKIEKVDAEVAEEIRTICKTYRPRFVLNMGDHPEELKVLGNLQATIKDRLSLETDYIGFIFNDSHVRKSVKEKVPHLTYYGDSMASDSIRSVARRVINYWDRPIDDSIDRLMKATQKAYDEEFIESYDISLTG